MRKSIIALTATAALATAATASSQSYVVYDLGALQGESLAFAINSSGSVVGAGPGGGGTSWIWDRRSGLRSLGAFPGGNGNARATAINNPGTVAGFAEIVTAAAQVTQAFRWTAGQGMQPIPGIGPGSDAFGINDAGEIVGGSAAVAGNGYLWKNGQITALGVLPGSQISQPYAVNNRSQVVGGSGDAFLWTAGTMTDLGRLPDARFSEAHAINDVGTVVGNDSGGSNEAFIWDARQGIRGLGVLDAACVTPFSDARAIDNHGEVVGYSCVSGTTTTSHAFVWDLTVGLRDLNGLVSLPAADVLSVAYGINERGQIVGNGIFEGAVHAFLLDPAE